MVHDLDSLTAGAEARKRVDEALQAVLGVDDVCRVSAVEAVRLVVEHERLGAAAPQDVEPSPDDDAIVLEGERSLGAHAGEQSDPPGELGADVGLDEGPDALDLVGRRRRVPTEHTLLEILRERR